MITLKKIFVCFLLLGSLNSFAQINYPNKTRLNDDWLFLKSDIGNIWEAVRPAGRNSPETVPIWEKVSLPHCFNAEDAVDPDVNYYQGPGWYKTQLTVDNPYKNGRTLLQFEGAGQKTDVYVFTEKVGSHVGGYDEWTVDITDAVKRFLASEDAKRFKGKVPLNIRCDNTRDAEMIPSDLSDFNVYGGIYRYLNLVYTPETAFENIQINTKVDLKKKTGELAIIASFNNQSAGTAKLNVKIFDPASKLVKEENITLNNSDTQQVLKMNLTKPVLWSPSSPSLYSCKLTLENNGDIMECEDKFGFRHFEFIDKGPFHLNGERLLLRGTHRHEDHAGVAAAMTEEMMVKEMEMMKEMGVNFIRLGHYQQSRIILEQCDRLGILVWEEIPWCRGGLGGAEYRAQAKGMLTNMIHQHRNHPSVILWGLGNENDWTNDFPHFYKDSIRAFMKELHDLSHQIDDTRLTCIRRCDFCKDIVDVYSPSIWAGWYRGIYTDYAKMYEENVPQVNHFLHVEWGGDSHAGRHAEYDYSKPTAQEIAKASNIKDWSETYICDLIDWHLKEQENMPWLTGAAYWPFKDFSTPVRPENPVPYVNQKGVVERDLTPKEPFYVFKSYWTNEPMVRIYGHTWETRWGKEGETKLVKIYSNCEKAELFVNGKSLGTKKRNSQDFPAAGLRWETTFSSGKNTVKAVAYKGKETITDELSFNYETREFGKEANINAKIIENTADYAWIEAEFTDENGVTCLTSQKYIRFDLAGDGKLVVNQGTSSGCKQLQAHNGKARIKVLKNNGESKIAVKSEGLKTVFIDL